jgi:SAM-dependent methyltransferase
MKMDETLYSLFDATEDTHWWFVARRAIVLALLRPLLPPGSPRILDIGCGTGSTLKELEGIGDAVGADISEEAIACCRRRGCRDIRLVQENGLPFAAGEFDAVLSLDVLEHIDDHRAALAEYRRVTKPGGVLLLTVPAYRWLWSVHDDINRHRRRYRRRPLADLLGSVDWKIERLTHFCTYLFPLTAVIRISLKAAARSLHRPEKGVELKIPGQIINRACQSIFAAEAAWLKRWNLPFGSSLMAVCRRQKP